MERVAGLIDGGKHAADVGVLYYAEAEWACGSSVMTTQRIVRVLNENQIACEVVPIEQLDPKRYRALLIPAAERWPKALFEVLKKAKQNGCAVTFIDRLPSGYADCPGVPKVPYECTSLGDAARWCRERVAMPVTPEKAFPMVHVYPYDGQSGRLYLIFNEDSREYTSFSGAFEGLTAPVLYDPEDGSCVLADGERHVNGFALTVTLTPGQLLVLANPLPGWPEAKPRAEYRSLCSVAPRWHVHFEGYDEKNFETDRPEDLFERCPRFAGKVRYEAEIELTQPIAGFEIENLYGAATLYVDGAAIGARVSRPYRFIGSVPAGRHTLLLECVNCPAYRWHDPLSVHGWLPPVGLCGDITLLETVDM
ncbi:MAG: hypothetical protein IJU28_04450 [Clostridia bacterium]|nr:hypothetical protein [Clostridia bacterium]